jgi:hypothetical protein
MQLLRANDSENFVGNSENFEGNSENFEGNSENFGPIVRILCPNQNIVRNARAK